MKFNFTFSLLILFALTTFGYAETAPNLPVSSQIIEDDNKNSVTKIDEIEILSEITIDTSVEASPSNPNLKDGLACDDSNLEPAELGPAFAELPMAETEPCSSVGCENLERAIMHEDNYKKLPMAQTIKGCDKK